MTRRPPCLQCGSRSHYLTECPDWAQRLYERCRALLQRKGAPTKTVAEYSTTDGEGSVLTIALVRTGDRYLVRFCAEVADELEARESFDQLVDLLAEASA